MNAIEPCAGMLPAENCAEEPELLLVAPFPPPLPPDDDDELPNVAVEDGSGRSRKGDEAEYVSCLSAGGALSVGGCSSNSSSLLLTGAVPMSFDQAAFVLARRGGRWRAGALWGTWNGFFDQRSRAQRMTDELPPWLETCSMMNESRWAASSMCWTDWTIRRGQQPPGGSQADASSSRG